MSGQHSHNYIAELNRSQNFPFFHSIDQIVVLVEGGLKSDGLLVGCGFNCRDPVQAFEAVSRKKVGQISVGETAEGIFSDDSAVRGEGNGGGRVDEVAEGEGFDRSGGICCEVDG